MENTSNTNGLGASKGPRSTLYSSLEDSLRGAAPIACAPSHDCLGVADAIDMLTAEIEAKMKHVRELSREAIYEDGLPFGGYRLQVGEGDADGATLSVNCRDITGKPVDAYVMVNARDLRALAAQCLASAEEVEKANQQSA